MSRVWCSDCGKKKLWFGSEEECLKWMNNNSSKLQKGKEWRAYYCLSCRGYHISTKKRPGGIMRTKENIAQCVSDLEKRKESENKISEFFLNDKIKRRGLKNKKTIRKFLKSLK